MGLQKLGVRHGVAVGLLVVALIALVSCAAVSSEQARPAADVSVEATDRPAGSAQPSGPIGRPIDPDRPIEFPGTDAPQSIEFVLGPGADTIAFTFDVSAPGNLDVEIVWSGEASRLEAYFGEGETARSNPEPAHSFQGRRRIVGSFNVDPDEKGTWVAGLRIAQGSARGSLKLTPSNGALLRPLLQWEPERAALRAEVAGLMAFYYFTLERVLSGYQDSLLEQRMAKRYADAPRVVKEAYQRELNRYRRMPEEAKLARGYDRDVLRRLQSIDKPLTPAERKALGRRLLRVPIDIAPKTPPHALENQSTELSDVEMRLYLTSITAHNETDACLIGCWFWCTEPGDDEVQAFSIAMQSKHVTTFEIEGFRDHCEKDTACIEELCKGQGRDCYAQSGIARGLCLDQVLALPDVLGENLPAQEMLRRREIYDACRLDDYLTNKLTIDDYWVHQADKFSLSNGQSAYPHDRVVPREPGLVWYPLYGAESKMEALVRLEFSLDTLVVSTVLLEEDMDVSADAKEAIDQRMQDLMESLNVLKADMDALSEEPSVLLRVLANVVGGALAESFYGLFPESIGTGTASFTHEGYLVDMSPGNEESDGVALQKPVAGSTLLSLRKNLNGCNSDYEVRERLYLRVDGKLDDQTLLVSPEALDFGTVPTGARENRIVTIRNAGVRALYIYKLVFSPGDGMSLSTAAGEAPCAAIEEKGMQGVPKGQYNLKGGVSCTLGVSFSPTRGQESEGDLVIQSNDADNPALLLSISGHGHGAPIDEPPQIRVSPSQCTFAAFDPPDPDAPLLPCYLTISNLQGGDLNLSFSGPATGIFELERHNLANACGDRMRLPALNSCRVKVTYKPTTLRIHRDELVVESNDPGAPRIGIPLRGLYSREPERDRQEPVR